MSGLVSPYDNEYDTTESRWFKIVVLIIVLIILILTVINIIYFNKARQGQTISSSEGSTLLWMNVVIVVIAAIILIWALWRILFSREYRNQIGANTRRYFQGQTTGIIPAPSATPVVAPAPVVAPGTVQYVPLVSTSGAASQNVLSPNAYQQIAGAQG